VTKEVARAYGRAAEELISLGQLEPGAVQLRLAVAAAPGEIKLRQRLADVLVQLGRVPEAIEQLQQVAGHFAAAGRPFQAMAVNLVILELDPAHRETQDALAGLYADRSGEVAAVAPRLPESMSGSLPEPGAPFGDDDDEQVQVGLPGKGQPLRAASLPPAGVRSMPSEPAAPGTPAPAPAPIDFNEDSHSAIGADVQPRGRRGGSNLARQMGGLLRRTSALRGRSRAGVLPARPRPAPPQREVTLDVAALSRTPFFSALERQAFVDVLEEMELRLAPEGHMIVEEGAPGDSMFVVVEGQVAVVRERGPDGARLPPDRRLLVARLGEGEFFGEMALINRSARLASVVAETDALLLELECDAFDGLLDRHRSLSDVLHTFSRERLLETLLHQSPLFREFGEIDRQRLSRRFVHHSLPRGAALIEQGHPSPGLCVLLRGRCSIIHTASSGQPLPAQTIREGDVFGEISLLFDVPAVATVRADTPVEVLELPRDAFRELVLPHPSVRAQIEHTARERLEEIRQGLSERGEWLRGLLV
jgi:cAMP-dependent protein kinase regulator